MPTEDRSVTPHRSQSGASRVTAASPQDLVKQALAAETRLRAALQKNVEREALAEAASTRLQERLTLGARMLKAFQNQIERVESALSVTDDRERALADLDRRIEEMITNAIGRVREASMQSIKSTIAERAAPLEGLDRTILALEGRVESLSEQVEAAESAPEPVSAPPAIEDPAAPGTTAEDVRGEMAELAIAMRGIADHVVALSAEVANGGSSPAPVMTESTESTETPDPQEPDSSLEPDSPPMEIIIGPAVGVTQPRPRPHSTPHDPNYSESV